MIDEVECKIIDDATKTATRACCTTVARSNTKLANLGDAPVTAFMGAATGFAVAEARAVDVRSLKFEWVAPPEVHSSVRRSATGEQAHTEGTGFCPGGGCVKPAPVVTLVDVDGGGGTVACEADGADGTVSDTEMCVSSGRPKRHAAKVRCSCRRLGRGGAAELGAGVPRVHDAAVGVEGHVGARHADQQPPPKLARLHLAIHSVTPRAVSIGGGCLTLQGVGFGHLAAATVSVGGVPCAPSLVGTTITCTVPPLHATVASARDR